MKYKRRSVLRMGTVGGLQDMAENIAVGNGLKKQKAKPYSGGIGQAVEDFFTGLGKKPASSEGLSGFYKTR